MGWTNHICFRNIRVSKLGDHPLPKNQRRKHRRNNKKMWWNPPSGSYSGTPKWMVYNGKPYEQMNYLGGKPTIFGTSTWVKQLHKLPERLFEDASFAVSPGTYFRRYVTTKCETGQSFAQGGLAVWENHIAPFKGIKSSNLQKGSLGGWTHPKFFGTKHHPPG